ncbi:MAG: AAA family ATPase, partial [Synergistaceae bacterium]|nr:AAA family ATPase [Synergistaceae bacterium]
WDDYALKFGNDAARKAIFEGRGGLKVLLMPEKERAKYLNHLDIVGLLGKLDPSIKLPPQEFIGGLFPRGFLSSIVAQSGIGKTVFMQKTVSDLSMGGTFFDGIAENEPPRKCLIFASEAGYELLLRRGAIFKWPVNPNNVIVADQYKYECKGISLMLDNPQGIENIKDIIYTVKPDIIFFDTFGFFHDKDENKGTDMKPIMRLLTDIARDLYIAIVLNHHSRKRTSKERALMLNQDDVIGSSVFNRLVSLIIGIEPISVEEKVLQVRPLKTWFKAFNIFNYKIGEDLYGHSVIETNLAPEDKSGGGSRIAVWNYLVDTFRQGEWFTASQIILSEIEGNVSERQLKTIFQEFVRAEKLNKRGATSNTEYSIA